MTLIEKFNTKLQEAKTQRKSFYILLGDLCGFARDSFYVLQILSM